MGMSLVLATAVVRLAAEPAHTLALALAVLALVLALAGQPLAVSLAGNCLRVVINLLCQCEMSRVGTVRNY